MVKIVKASSEYDYSAVRDLITAYQAWLGIDLAFQGFSKELETLSVMYGPPRGAMLLAQVDEVWVGCVGLRQLPDGNAEMKRMFVLPNYQGKGIGRALMQAFITTARELDYTAVRLDTVPELDQAIRLYERAGFVQIAPYCYNPAPDAMFFELSL
ncbi:MAG: GNAT family N-acetyltransferase [Cyanobacteria bacterium P01_G01_bin.38]